MTITARSPKYDKQFSHPTFDFGFFGDDPTSPTFIYCVDQYGKTVSNYVDPSGMSALLRSKLASGKRYYFGPSRFIMDCDVDITTSGHVVGTPFHAGVDMEGLTDIVFEAHPKSVLQMKDGAYESGSPSFAEMFYLNNNSNIQFLRVNFDGRKTQTSGAEYRGCIYQNDATGNRFAIIGCYFYKALQAMYGDPPEYKAGAYAPRAEWGTALSDNVFYDCGSAINYHNGPSGSYIVRNIVEYAGTGVFFDSNSDIICGDNIIRECATGIRIYDGAERCIVRNNIIQHTTGGTTGILIRTTGGVKPLANKNVVCNNVISGIYTNGIIVDGADNILTGNYFVGVTNKIVNTGSNNLISENVGFIAPGEVRTKSGSIATLTQDAFNSVDNPFGQNVALLSLDIYVATGATATSPNIDCGIGSSKTTDYTNLFDDLPGETIGLYNSKVATPGTQTQPILWQTGAGNRYLNMSIKDAAATGMVATYVATVMGV